MDAQEGGIPDEFRMEDLTEDQERAVCLVANVARLLKEGLVTVQFTDEDEGPRVALTEKRLQGSRGNGSAER